MPKPAWIIEAEKHVGFHEGPNNDNPFGKHYGLNHLPYCALCVSYCCEHSGHPLPSMQPGMPNGFAAVVYGMNWAKDHGFWRPSWKAVAGDAVVYGWNGPGSSPENMHVGFITDPGNGPGSTAHTIEGNRNDRVGRFTYTVGERVVLGTIALTEILKAPKPKPAAKPTVKPEPQPRHPKHPTNTGPTAKQKRVRELRRAWARLLRLIKRGHV